MKLSFLLTLSLSSVSGLSYAQSETKSSSELETEDVSQQPVLIVTDEIPNIPAPLQNQAQKVNSWSGSASFTTAEYWQNQRAANIKDVLDFVPGVFAQQRNGAESSRISIRGSGLGRQFQGGGLLLLQDGIPLNTADGSFDFQAVDPWLIDYVTVYRGANGFAQGGSSLGGVINLGTTLPNAEQDNQLRVSVGSFGTRRGSVSYTNNNSNSTFRIRASHFNQDGFRVQNQQNSNRFDLQHLIKSDSKWQHRFGLYHLNTHAELPSSLSRALINEDPRQSRGFNIFGNFNRDLTLTRFSYQVSNQQLQATFFVAQKELDNPVFTYINRDSDDSGINISWQQDRHHLHFSSQWGEQDELRRENEGGFPGADRLYRQQDAQTTTTSYQYSMPLAKTNNKWTLDLGLQGIYAQRNIKETFPNSIISNQSYAQFNPRAALRFQPKSNLQWFSSLSRSFEVPTFAELNNGNRPGLNTNPNGPIKAQTADTFEIGGRGFTQWLSWEVSIYHSQVDNEFIRFRFPDGSTSTTNANESTRFGIESLISWQVNDQLTVTTAYQYSQFKLDNDINFNNNDIPGIPKNYVQSRFEYRPNSKWLIAPNFEWVPSGYFIDLANTVKTDNYLLTGLNITYTSNKKIQWFLDAKNLTDKSYISTSLPIPDAGGIDGNYFYSGEGRAFYTGIKYSF